MKLDPIIKSEKVFGVVGVGDNCRKLVEDFRYIFDEKINLGETTIWNEAQAAFVRKYEYYVCCCYERDKVADSLDAAGLAYKKDYIYAEDCFFLLDDWKNHKIAYVSYPGSVKGWIKAILFGYAAKHGKVLWNDRHKDLLNGLFETTQIDRRGSCLSKRRKTEKLVSALCFIPGFFESLLQLPAKKRMYEDFDYICFYEISDAIRFKNDHPSVREKVITVDELKTHTMASLYMRAVYFDRRQNPCVCDMPFQALWIGIGGKTRMCDCPEFLDVGYGNIGVTDPDKIWKSALAKIIRLSVINNTYTFCSRDLCGKFRVHKDQTSLLDRRDGIKENDHPGLLMVADENICNLHCPSCRREILVKNDEDVKKRITECEKALLASGWLETADRLIIGGNGEAFLSDHYKRILYGGMIRRNSILIMTNGTLFTPNEWEKLEGKYEHISFSVSIDAATKETYEKVRCGGNYERLMENMAFLSGLRKNGKVDCVKVNMIVQRANYTEIPDFIRWTKENGFDGVNLSHIRNWGTFTDTYFEEHVSMFDKNGKMKTELKKVMEDPICRDSIVAASWKR